MGCHGSAFPVISLYKNRKKQYLPINNTVTMKLTPILLFPFIFMPPCVAALENYLLTISPRPSSNYATCHTYPLLSDLLCSTASIPTQKELSDQVGNPLNSSSFCCGEQGYLTYGTCTGYEGKCYSNVPVCQGPGLAGRREKKRMQIKNQRECDSGGAGRGDEEGGQQLLSDIHL